MTDGQNGHRRTSSVDILSEDLGESAPAVAAAAMPLSEAAAAADPVLKPKVLTARDLEEQQKEAAASEEIVKAKGRDPYGAEETQQKLLGELRKFESLVEKFCSDRTALDSLWKDMNIRSEEKDPRFRPAISVARCYPMKNRLPDVLPFDVTRVELPTTKDDYINASHVRDLSRHCPKFIATQAPAANTLADFWTMVWQEQVTDSKWRYC